MLQKFNEHFNISGPLKIVELEQELLNQFKDFTYCRYPQTILMDQIIAEQYWFGVQQSWGDYNYSTKNAYKSREDALMGFFLEQVTCQDEEEVEDFYTTKVSPQIFEEIVRNVYK